MLLLENESKETTHLLHNVNSEVTRSLDPNLHINLYQFTPELLQGTIPVVAFSIGCKPRNYHKETSTEAQ